MEVPGPSSQTVAHAAAPGPSPWTHVPVSGPSVAPRSGSRLVNKHADPAAHAGRGNMGGNPPELHGPPAGMHPTPASSQQRARSASATGATQSPTVGRSRRHTSQVVTLTLANAQRAAPPAAHAVAHCGSTPARSRHTPGSDASAIMDMAGDTAVSTHSAAATQAGAGGKPPTLHSAPTGVHPMPKFRQQVNAASGPTGGLHAPVGAGPHTPENKGEQSLVQVVGAHVYGFVLQALATHTRGRQARGTP